MQKAARARWCEQRLVTVLLMPILGWLCPSPAAARPNVVIIFADDMGYGDVACYDAIDFNTPHIDSIAAHGVKFTAGYVTASICGPSRAGLLSGRYQQRFGFETNPTPPWVAWDNYLGLPTAIEILPELLKRAGYTTGVVGKWHLGLRPQFHPNHRGVDYFWGMQTGMHSYIKTHDFWFNWGNEIQENGKPDDDWSYLTDAIAARGVEFIQRHAGEPFFLYLPFNAPHGPTQATADYLARVPLRVREARRAYAAMIIALDDGVGRILETLRRYDLEKNTLVFFLTDNGVHRAVKSRSSSLNGGKGCIEDGGVRVPFLVQWPGVIPEGVEYDKLVCSFDLYATAAAVAGIEPRQPIDGVNLLPFVVGKNQASPHDTLYWREFTRAGLRHGKWKLIREAGLPTALYDLEKDPGETENLIAEMPERTAALEGLWNSFNDEMKPPSFGEPQKSDYAEQRRLWRNRIDFRSVPPNQRWERGTAID